jgi:hypothetical protein
MSFINQTFNKLANKFFNSTIQVDPSSISTSGSDVNKNLLIEFYNISKNKESIFEQINEISDFYFSQLIVDRLIEDSLGTSVDNNAIFSVNIKNSDGSNDEPLTNVVNDFINKFNLQQVILDVAPDLIKYGEYFLRLDVIPPNTKDANINYGIYNIYDDVDSRKVTPVFKDSDILHYIHQDNKGHITQEQPSKYAYFSLLTNRIKVAVEAKDKTLFMRMGRSVLYPVIGLIKELKLLETMIPIKFLNTQLQSALISVTVPSTTKPADALQIMQDYEKMLNNTLKVDLNKKTDNEILRILSNRMGKVKVIPNYGDKGSLNKEEILDKDDYNSLFEKIDDLRRMILLTIGIPPNIISDENSFKSENIKSYVRYNKKLKMIQKSMIDGLKRIILIHLINSGYDNVVVDDIEVNLLNAINIDEVDKFEMLDLLISIQDNFLSYLTNVDAMEGISIDPKEVVKFLNEGLGQVTTHRFFKLEEEE